MKAFLFLIFFISCLNLKLQAEIISLQDAFEQVCRCNLSYRRQLALTESNRQDLYIQRSELLPQVNLSGTQGRSKMSKNFGGSDSINFYTTRFDGNIQGDLAILDLPKIYNYRIAKQAYSIAQLDTDKTLQENLKAVAQAFYLYNRNLQRLKVLDANIERSETLLDFAKLSFDAGVANTLDVTRAKVQLAIDKKAKLQHETDLINSELQLKKLLNYPIEECLELKTSSVFESPEDYCCNYPAALKLRSDYLSAVKQKELHRLESRAAALERFPTLAGSAKWGVTGEHLFNGGLNRVWSVGATASMPFFDGGRIHAKREKAETLVRAQAATIQDLENQIASEVAFNEKNLKSQYEQVKISEEQVSLGEEELELAKVRFQEHVADNADIVTAQAKLAQFSDELVNSHYSYQMAKISWASTMGDMMLLLQKYESEK